MTNLARFVLVGGMFALCPSLVQAQLNPYHGRSAAGLRADDYKSIDEAVTTLLARPDLNVGSTELWKNDKSGASGTVSVEDTNRHRGLTCHRVNYATAQQGGRHRDTVVNWCKTPAGWKIG